MKINQDNYVIHYMINILSKIIIIIEIEVENARQPDII